MTPTRGQDASKKLAKYFILTKDWGIMYKRSVPREDLPQGKFDTNCPNTESLPEYPEKIDQPKLICFVDAAYGINTDKQRSTTGLAMTYYRVAIKSLNYHSIRFDRSRTYSRSNCC